jgi:hypothetical protein
MTDLKAFRIKLTQNLNVLREREAKYSGNAPLELLNQIEDHKTAIELIKKAMAGEISEAELEKSLEPLLVAIERRSAPFSTVTIGDVTGDFHNSIFAGTIIVAGDWITNFGVDVFPEKYASKPEVDIASRLEEYDLGDPSDPNFGVNKLTRNLLQVIRSSKGSGFENQVATSFTKFLAIPTDLIQFDSSNTLKVASEIFDIKKWYGQSGDEKHDPGFRYYAHSIFPLGNAQSRTAQKNVILEEIISLPQSGRDFVGFSLSVNEFGEVSFATSYYTVDQYESGLRIFRLGGTIHLFWSFLCLVRELQERIGYAGENHVCIAMVGTEGAYLGNFAKGQPGEPYPGQRNPLRSLGGSPEEVCHDSNLVVCRDTDLSVLERKVEPEIIYEVAEEIARAFNQPEARCFDKKTRKLPGDLWPVSR